jgi:hydroxypyruvate isomerase
MERRSFVGTGLAALAGAAASRESLGASAPAPAPFRLRYAPHLGMFKQHAGDDAVAQLDFMADQGFTAFEDNGMRGRPVAEQERLAAAMRRHNIQMGVFVAHTIFWTETSLAGGKADARDRFLSEITSSVDVAKRVNAKWMTVVPGHVDRRLDLQYQTAHVVETLKRATDILEPHGLVMVLEPLNTLRDHPGMFLTQVPQAYLICKAVASPACKILFDMYHQQITEGNLIPNIESAWDEVAYFQIGDNPGRNEPTTGEINYRNICRHIHAKGFTGVLGMEHGNSRPGRDGELAVIAAYREIDSF